MLSVSSLYMDFISAAIYSPHTNAARKKGMYFR